jgi:hypothetical protein
MRDYRGYLEGSAVVSWQAEAFEPKAAWREALSRLTVHAPHVAVT